jgi:hypothetical protein
MGLILEVGLIAAFGVANTPFDNKSDYQTPYILVERSIYEDFYASVYNSSRTQAKRLNMADPKTALWQVEVGLRKHGLTLAFGHVSEHEVGSSDKLTQSNDYVKISIREEY